jgi:ABC-type nitrate/sulfonate/bicarbonate transport system substrate-binding protein
MSTATLKRELALLRSSLAALTPAQSAVLDDPVAWAERIAGLSLDPWQRDVLLSVSPRLLLNATRTERQEHSGGAQGRPDGFRRRPRRGG